MKSRYFVPLFLCLPALAMAEPIAHVTAVRGHATLADHALAVGDELDRGAEVHTGADGRVRLAFVDGSTLVVSDHTVMKIERFDLAADKRREAATFVLAAGLIGQKVAPSDNGSWQVRTPTAVTAVRGTEFMVEVSDDQATAVNVQSGKVDVDPLPTRSLHPHPSVKLVDPLAGTMCSLAAGCSQSSIWSEERVKKAQERLSLD